MIAVATWNDGLFLVGATSRHELAGRSLRGLTSDRHGGLVAIVDGTTLQRRTADGEWHKLATSDLPLACCVALPDALFVGTDDARVLRWTDGGGLEPLAAFAHVAGRERWYAGTAVVDGKVVGPPLGVRSMCASCDDRTILVNVHVGGICRSTDGGQSWEPTIDVDADVHEVRAHPERADTLVAAAAVGLCISTDGGRSWSIDHDGLHAPHCSAVVCSGDDVLVSASTDPFASEGAVYRRSLEGGGTLGTLDGLPRWLAGAPDTGCIDARGGEIAIVDRGGRLYASADGGGSWSVHDARLPMATGVLLYGGPIEYLPGVERQEGIAWRQTCA